MARRADHSKRELKDLVLQATTELVDEHRAVNVTARMIAERIGYTAGTLYVHFKNLSDIFLHVNAQSLEALRLQCEAAVAKVRQPKKALLELGFAYYAFAEAHPNRFELMFTQQLAKGEVVPAFLQKNIDRLFALVEFHLRKLSKNIDEETLELNVRALWSGVHGVVALSMADQLFTRRWRADRDILKSLVQNFLHQWPARDA